MGKLIDAQHFLDRVLPLCSVPEALQKNVDEEPAVDAVQVVRCGDCKFFGRDWCRILKTPMLEKGFCSDGERKDDDRDGR